ncbi:hypothetical protein MSPP1_001929 [Malassezia sp. CBS 17886]|nr:hypothetical protein MSPP1_001929 [Malassezia sp. CBS 17886]
MPQRPRSRALEAHAVVLGAAALVAGAAAWYLSSRRSRGDTQDRPPGPAENSKKPTLSISFPVGATLTPVPAGVHSLMRKASDQFQVRVLHESATGSRPSVPFVDPVFVLAYSTREGRAALARALGCQCHVELLYVTADGNMVLGRDEGDALTLSTYLQQMDMLSRATDVTLVALIPAPDALSAHAVERADSFAAAWADHAHAESAQLLDLRKSEDPWAELAEKVERQRRAWH